MGEEPQKEKSWKGVTVVILLLVIFLVAYSLYSGSVIKRLNMPGFEVEFAERTQGIVTEKKVAEVGEDELRERQASMESKLKDLQARLEAKGDGSSVLVADTKKVIAPAEVKEQPALSLDLSGTWRPPASDPSVYTIWQNGDALVLEQAIPPGDALAVGQGQIVGRNINITYTTFLGTTGRGTATISPDGNQITGQVTDLTTGVTTPLIISR